MTALDTFAATLAPGQFAQFSSPSIAAFYDPVARVFEPSQAARTAATAGGWSAVHMADWMSHMAWDQATDSYWIAGGRDRFQALPQNLVSYHAAGNQWTHRPGWSGVGGGHCYQSSCVGGGKVYYSPSAGGDIQVWDIASDTLSGSIPKPASNVCPPYSSSWAAAEALAFLPWMGAQGSLLWVNTNSSTNATRRLSRIARYDFASSTWLPVFAAKDVWNNQHLIALPSRHGPVALVGATGNTEPKALALLDASGSLAFLPVGPFSLIAGGTTRGMLVEHPERQEWIVFCLNTKRIWSLPPGASAWVDRGPVEPGLLNANSCAMPTRFGAAFFRYRSGGQSSMWAWKPGF